MSDISATTPEVKTSRGISSLWLLPIVAALVGIWLVYQHLSSQGPLITLTFVTADGLEAKRTKIKFKNVEVGSVETVQLDSELEHIIVTARMDRGFSPYLTANTRFWVVRPRIDTTGISGLNTLISGAYIAVEPSFSKPADEIQTQFTGLETPPITPNDAPGLHLNLIAEQIGSINIGTAVYYKQIKVGQVENRKLDIDSQVFQLEAFIKAPYHQLINTNTRFWNASGFDVSVGSDGLSFRTESIEALVLGGITFDTITTTTSPEPVSNGALFMLYPDQASIGDAAITARSYLVMHFEDSIRGLNPGAPVEFRGVRLGRVKDISVVYDANRSTLRLPVLVELELERISQGATDEQSSLDILQNLVQQGLRARLQTGNLLTGQLFITLDILPDAEPAKVQLNGAYPELPTVASTLNQITDSATAIMSKIEQLPLEDVIKSINLIFSDVRELINSRETQAIPTNINQALATFSNTGKNVDQQLQKTLQQLNTTLANGNDLLLSLGPDSTLHYELTRALRGLTRAAQQVRDLSEQLDKAPSSVLFGR